MPYFTGSIQPTATAGEPQFSWLGARRRGLTVADASIMPTIPRATTNLPTIMVAEHIARWIRDN